MTEPTLVTAEQLVAEVMGDQELMQVLNDNPLKVSINEEGTEAELSISEVIPPIVAATVNALHRLEVIVFTPDPALAEQSQVG